jgi:hypothetical protein
MKSFALSIACFLSLTLLATDTGAGWGQPWRPTVVGPVCRPGMPCWQPAAQPVAVQPPDISRLGPPGSVTLPTGVNAGMLSSKVETYGISGHSMSQQGVYQALGAGELVDDSRKSTISVIHRDKATRVALLGQIRTAMGDSVKYWEGAPEDWSLAPAGFKTDSPDGSIYMTAADGSVEHRQDHTDIAPFVRIAQQRKADPHYDPRRDPDLTKPQLGDLGKSLPFLLILAGVGFTVYTVTRKPVSK